MFFFVVCVCVCVCVCVYVCAFTNSGELLIPMFQINSKKFIDRIRCRCYATNYLLTGQSNHCESGCCPLQGHRGLSGRRLSYVVSNRNCFSIAGFVIGLTVRAYLCNLFSFASSSSL